MNREYYIYWYQLNEKDFYLIFYYDEQDGFIVDGNGFVLSFHKIENLQNHSQKIGIKVDIEAPNLLNLDLIQNWLVENKFEIDNYNPFLEAWNLFDDISKTTGGNFDLDKELTNNIYDKIFWGCNIPAMTPEGKSFTPNWTKKELKIIRDTLNSGFLMFSEKVKYI